MSDTERAEAAAVVGAGGSRPGQVVTAGPLPSSLETPLIERYGARALPDGPQRAEFLAGQEAHVRLVVTTGAVGVDSELMSALPSFLTPV
jgi:hypothetical protein